MTLSSLHRSIHQIALPMMLSSVSLPLLGLVDTAILGHLSSPIYLAAINVGLSAVNLLLWGFGFLRMSTTGLIAQSAGARDGQLTAHVIRALSLATTLGLMVALTQPWLSQGLLLILAPDSTANELAESFLSIRLWAAPFQFIFFTLCGYFLGSNQAGKVLVLTLLSQISNMVLDYVFVVELGWHVRGVAWGSLLSEASACVLGLYWLVTDPKLSIRQTLKKHHWIQRQQFTALFQLNRDVFVRTLCLMAVFAFITRQSAAQGELVLAINAVLLNFFYLASYALDGYAHAIESIGGRLYGAKNFTHLKLTQATTMRWAFFAAGLMTALFVFFGDNIVALLTDLETVRNGAATYLAWLAWLPILACASFVYDGLCIGMTLGRMMRNNLLFATFAGFFPTWYIGTLVWGQEVSHNHLLWLAFWVFFVVRTISIHWQLKTFLRSSAL